MFLAIRAALELGRHTVGRRGKMAVASPAFAAAGDRNGVSVCHQVREEVPTVEVVNRGSDRQQDLDGFASASGTVRPAPCLPIFRLVMPLIPKVEKRRQPLGSGEDHIAAIAAVAAVGPAARHEHLTAEAATPIAAATGFYCNGDFVNKHCILPCG